RAHSTCAEKPLQPIATSDDSPGRGDHRLKCDYRVGRIRWSASRELAKLDKQQPAGVAPVHVIVDFCSSFRRQLCLHERKDRLLRRTTWRGGWALFRCSAHGGAILIR